MKILLILITSCLSISVSAQLQDNADSIKVSFEFPSTVAKDSNDLVFRVIFHNPSRRTKFAYAILVDGGPNDEDCNMYIDVEKLKGLDYKYYPLRFYHKMGEVKTDSICRDVPKRELPSLSTDTLSYNLLMIGKSFETGKYRLKIHLRKSCKIFLPKGDGDTWYAEIDYVTSEWLYFQVEKDIFGKLVKKAD